MHWLFRKEFYKSSVFLGGYVAVIIVWFVLWFIFNDGIWWLMFLNRIVPYLFVPTLFLLAWVVFSRRYRLLPLIMIPVALFFVLFHPYVLPKVMVSEKTNVDLTVMTFNVRFGNQDYDAVADMILTYQPDLVALQEVQPEMMTALQLFISDAYPYSQMGAVHEYGTTAVFSRHPISDATILDLEADRPAVVVKAEIDGKPITFISSHLLAYGLWWVDWGDIPSVADERTIAQNRQVQILLEEIEQLEGPVILGCDCNSKEISSSYRMLEDVMQNSARQIGWTLRRNEIVNARQDVNLQHIDYIFFQGQINPANIVTIQNKSGSDHFPVFAEFYFN